MKNSGIRWINSIFSRLLITFLLIILPLYALGIVIYNWGLGTVRTQMSDSMNAQVSFYLDGLQKEIQRIQVLQFDCVNDFDLSDLSAIPQSMNEFEKSRAILRLQRRLLAIQNSSDYISSASAYILSINRVVAANGGNDEIDPVELEAVESSSRSADSQIVYRNGQVFLNLMYPVGSLTDGTDPMFILQIELSKSKLNAALRHFNNGPEGTFLVNPSQDLIIASASESGAAQSVFSALKKQLKHPVNQSYRIRIDNKPYLVICAVSPYLQMTMYQYIQEQQVFQPLKKYEIFFWIFSLVSVAIIFVYSFSSFKFLHQPLTKLVKAFKNVENGELDIKIQHKHKDEFGYLYQRFNTMVENLGVLIDQVYKQRILAQRAELKQLQSQINPHFLYNSFFILHRMVVGEDIENAALFSEQLGNYFRFITRSGADEVPLAKEAEHAGIYTNIQTLRFTGRIKVETEELPDAYHPLMVPRLIMQPIIENAFEHGLKMKEEAGLLRIRYKAADESLQIIIEDNGEGFTQADLEEMNTRLLHAENEKENTGIFNIHRRIRLKFGEAYGLRIGRSGLGGLMVAIIIPLKEEEHV